MVQYSPRSSKAQAFLKRSYNDLDVYVEDSSCQNMWVNLINNHLPEGKKIESIISLDGRSNILQACKEDQLDTERKKIYIMDADYDFLLKKRKPNLKHLYRLRAYCVENIILNEESLIEVACQSDTNTTKTRAKRLLDYKPLIELLDKQLSFLFIIYATSFTLTPQIKTVKYSIFKLLNDDENPFGLCDTKIYNRGIALSREIVQIANKDNFHKTLQKIKKNTVKLDINMKVSGKDYLFHLFRAHLKYKFNFRGTNDQLKVALAKECCSKTEPYLAKRLRKIFSS